MGECVAKWILELEPENVAAYVLLPNIYAAGGNRHLQTAEKGKRCWETVGQHLDQTELSGACICSRQPRPLSDDWIQRFSVLVQRLSVFIDGPGY